MIQEEPNINAPQGEVIWQGEERADMVHNLWLVDLQKVVKALFSIIRHFFIVR